MTTVTTSRNATVTTTEAVTWSGIGASFTQLVLDNAAQFPRLAALKPRDAFLETEHEFLTLVPAILDYYDAMFANEAETPVRLGTRPRVTVKRAKADGYVRAVFEVQYKDKFDKWYWVPMTGWVLATR